MKINLFKRKHRHTWVVEFDHFAGCRLTYCKGCGVSGPVPELPERRFPGHSNPPPPPPRKTKDNIQVPYPDPVSEHQRSKNIGYIMGYRAAIKLKNKP